MGLHRVGQTSNVSEQGAVVRIADAPYPAPFASELEFNPPVHGTWNIVHTGMLVPESIQIYVCADNCMRGVVLTAAEMNVADRFSFVILEEKEVVLGNLDAATIEGVTDVLNKRKDRPRAVLLFTVCLHHFLGCNLNYIYRELERRFPDIIFLRCYMDPIMKKHGLSPDQKLRKAMYDALEPTDPIPHCVTFLGSDFALDKNSDIRRFLLNHNYTLRELPAPDDDASASPRTWKDYQKLAEGRLFLASYPSAKYGLEVQARRLGRPWLYLPGSFDYEENEAQLCSLAKALELAPPSAAAFARERAACEEKLKTAKTVVGERPIAIDYQFHPRPLGLAKLLLEHGFCVKTVYLDAVSPEEKETFFWLQKHAPDLELRATIHVKMRVLPRNASDTLAIGQKAAWFSGTRHFVNMVEGGGLNGFGGICRLADLLIDACENEKETERLVVQKGWGCECCL